MRSSYLEKDVTLLLKDLSGQMVPQDSWEREIKIQSGVHYSEMLPLEHKPSAQYMALYQEALVRSGPLTAYAVKCVAEKILQLKGEAVVLVSLARAGLPIGILVKHYLAQYHNMDVAHYGVSIIRGKGIDRNALNDILTRHRPEQIQFIDGWTGKGAIATQLQAAVNDYPGLSDQLAVLADPAWITELCGTHEDFLIPSACLNATASGLLSRTILNPKFIGSEDYHGAVYFAELASEDRSYEFIQAIEDLFPQIAHQAVQDTTLDHRNGLQEAQKIAQDFGIKDINLVKPGVGETTRVLLRRVPWKILIKENESSVELAHILRLAEEKQIEVVPYPLQTYRVCGLIRNLQADV